MKKYTVKLTGEERKNLLSLTKTGKHAASKILHAGTSRNPRNLAGIMVS